jgi:hypothetical protein
MAATPPIPPNDPASTPQSTDVLSIQQKYAWDWFSYHAAQRMTALNYFFVTVGIFAVAYSKCVENKWTGFGCLVGVLGALSSVAFWFLDVRNEELVNCGRDALRSVEMQLKVTPRQHDHDRTFLTTSTGWLSGSILSILRVFLPESRKNVVGSSGRRKFWAGDVFAHRFWLRTLQSLAFAAFAGGAIFALLGYPSLQHWPLWRCFHP